MALTNTEKEVSQLIINKVPTNEIYQQMVEQNLVNDDELYLIQDDNRLKVNGILKGDGAGGVSAAVANTDYATCTNLLNGSGEGSLRASLTMEENSNYKIGNYAFAEGLFTQASGECSHAEGGNTWATMFGAHSEGAGTNASGEQSHAEGMNTVANHRSQHVQGECNIPDNSTNAANARGNYVHIVGNGTDTTDSERSNAHTLDWSGNAWFAGDVYVGSTSGKNKDAGSKKLVNSDEVLSAIEDASETYFATQGSFESNDFTVSEIPTLSNICSELNNRILTCIDGGVSIIPLNDAMKPCLIVKSIYSPDNTYDNIILKYSGIGSTEESSKFTGLCFDVGAQKHYSVSVEWDFRTETFLNKQIDKIEDKVFVATYGTTTYSEVYNAKQAGKIVICAYESGTVGHKSYYFYDNSFQQFITNQTTETVLEFTQGSKWVRLTAKNVWSNGVHNPTINGKTLTDTTNLELGAVYTATLTTTGWNTSEAWKIQYAYVPGLKSTYNAAPFVDVALSGTDAAADAELAAAWLGISASAMAGTGPDMLTITFPATIDTPTVNIPIRITTYD